MSHNKIDFTEEMDQFIKDNNDGVSGIELHRRFKRNFHSKIGINTLKKRRKDLGLHSGLTGRFEKGQESWNKGKRMPSHPNTKKTQFKKGHRPALYRPVGSERMAVDGYIEVKVADPGTWRQKHRMVYEEHYGPVPKGHVVMFADQNKLNCHPDNLILASRKQMAIVNHMDLLQDTKELNQSALLLADVISAAHQKKQSLKKKRSKNND